MSLQHRRQGQRDKKNQHKPLLSKFQLAVHCGTWATEVPEKDSQNKSGLVAVKICAESYLGQCCENRSVPTLPKPEGLPKDLLNAETPQIYYWDSALPFERDKIQLHQPETKAQAPNHGNIIGH